MKIKEIKRLLILLMMTAAAVSLHAQDLVPQGLQTMAEGVRDIFTGDLAKLILGCCFAGSCIAYGYNKDNEKMKGKILAVVIATGLLCITQQVMDKLWTIT